MQGLFHRRLHPAPKPLARGSTLFLHPERQAPLVALVIGSRARPCDVSEGLEDGLVKVAIARRAPDFHLRDFAIRGHEELDLGGQRVADASRLGFFKRIPQSVVQGGDVDCHPVGFRARQRFAAATAALVRGRAAHHAGGDALGVDLGCLRNLRRRGLRRRMLLEKFLISPPFFFLQLLADRSLGRTKTNSYPLPGRYAPCCCQMENRT